MSSTESPGDGTQQVTPDADPDGQVRGVVVAMSDLSERRLAERQREETARRIDAAMGRLIAEAHERARAVLTANRAVLDAITAGEDPEHIAEDWRPQVEAFERRRQDALLYPDR